jgi:hypothetical protein
MASLSTLPNELLILIFTACPSTQAAARLSATSRCLLEIWRKNTEHITAEILRAQIPEYDMAVKLAKYEIGEHFPLTDWMPRLLHNADLALATCDAFLAFEDNNRSRGVGSGELSSAHASYYTLRQLVEAYSNVNIQETVSLAIDECSLKEARTHHTMSTFLSVDIMEDDLVQRHGMIRPKETWTWEEKLDGYGVKEGWNWADDVVGLVWMEKERPGFTAPHHPCPWRFGDVCCGRDCGRGLRLAGDV